MINGDVTASTLRASFAPAIQTAVLLLLALAEPVAIATTSEEPPQRPRRVAVLVYDGVATIDFAGPLDVLAHAGLMYRSSDGSPGFDVFTIAAKRGPVKPMGGLTILPERVLSDDVRADILILPGGANEPLLADVEAMSRLATLASGAEIRMSVCTGAWILGALGLLDGIEATATSPAALQRRFPRARVVTGRRFVDAGRVITTCEGATGIDGALRIVERCMGLPAAEQVAAHMAYPWTPESGGLAAAHAAGEHTVPEVPHSHRLYLGAIEKLDGTDDTNPSQALRWLRGSFEAGYERPSAVLSDPAFSPLRNDASHRAQIRELLAAHAREANIQLVPADEPGEPLIVSGTVLDAAGRPVDGALVYVFHTDCSGYYSQGGMDEDNPRLFGYMLTGPDGRYEFRTIRPGHYPDQAEPVEQHIHFEVTAPGYASQGHRLAFSDDPLWDRPGLAGDPFWRRHLPFPPPWAALVTRGAEGIARCECDLRLRNE